MSSENPSVGQSEGGLGRLNSTSLAWAAIEATGKDPNVDSQPVAHLRNVLDALKSARESPALSDQATAVSVEMAKRLLEGTGFQVLPLEQGPHHG